MDLTCWLLRRMPVRPLIVATRGGTAARLAVERMAQVRSWRPALSPAEANLLVLAGPGSASMAPFVDAVWESVPVPRARVQLSSATNAEEMLTAAVAELRDPELQRSEATRLAEPSGHAQHDRDRRVEHEMSGDHAMHHGHDMDAMDLPGGIAMADRAADRDGLMLDRLTVPLGPLLSDWPAGLVVRMAVQGDVIQEASVAVLDAEAGPGFWHLDGPDVARRLDSCARLLAVAGWEHAAMRSRFLRDSVLLGHWDQRAVERWARRVRRSRVLRWSLKGLGVLSGAPWDGTMYAGDAYDRLVRWLDFPADEPAMTGVVLETLPSLLVGSELAGARLVVASLDPDTEVLAGVAATHG